MRPVLACFTRVEEPPSIFVSVMSDEPGSVGITAVLPRASFATSDATAEFIASVIQYQPPSCRPRISTLPPASSLHARPLSSPKIHGDKALIRLHVPGNDQAAATDAEGDFVDPFSGHTDEAARTHEVRRHVALVVRAGERLAEARAYRHAETAART